MSECLLLAQRESLSVEFLEFLKIVDRKNFDMGGKDIEEEDDDADEKSDTFIMDKFEEDSE